MINSLSKLPYLLMILFGSIFHMDSQITDNSDIKVYSDQM